MWFRLDNGGARNLETGHVFAVRPVSDERSQTTWEIYSTIPVPGVGATILQAGYATPEAAQEALDGFLAEHGVVVVDLSDPNADVPAEGTEGPAEESEETAAEEAPAEDATPDEATPVDDEFAEAEESTSTRTTRRGRNR